MTPALTPKALTHAVRRDLLDSGTALPRLRGLLDRKDLSHALTEAVCGHLYTLGYWDHAILAVEGALDRFPGSVALHLHAAAHDPAYLGLAETLARDTGRDLALVARAYLDQDQPELALGLWRARAPSEATLPTLAVADLSAQAEAHLALRALAPAMDCAARLHALAPQAPQTARLALRLAWLQEGPAGVRAWIEAQPEAALRISAPVFQRLLAGRDLQAAAAWAAQAGDLPLAPALLALRSAQPERAEALLAPLCDAHPPETWPHPWWEASVRAALALGAQGHGRARARLSQARRLFPRALVFDQLAADLAWQTGDWSAARAALAMRSGSGRNGPRARAQAELAHRVGATAPGATGAQAARHALDRGDVDSAQVQAQALARQWWEERVHALHLDADLALRTGALEGARTALAALEATAPLRPATAHLATRIALLAGQGAEARAARARYRALRAVVPAAGQDMIPARFDVPDLMLTAPVSPEGEATAQAVATLFARGVGEGPRTPSQATAIPRQILSYWEGPRTAPLDQICASWQDLHPGWAWRSFDRVEAEDWLTAHATAPLSAAFARAGGAAQRADLFRLAVLAREGGLYVDLDDLPRSSVTGLLDGADLVLVQEAGHGAIANNFMAARPGHPFLARLAEHAAQAPACAGVETWLATGPGLVARTLAAWLAEEPLPGLARLPWTRYSAHVSAHLHVPHKFEPAYWRRQDRPLATEHPSGAEGPPPIAR